MNTIIDGLRSIVGSPDFYLSSGAFDYGAIMEYMVSCLILIVVVVFAVRSVAKMFD